MQRAERRVLGFSRGMSKLSMTSRTALPRCTVNREVRAHKGPTGALYLLILNLFNAKH